MAKIRTEQIENLTTADVTASTDKNYVTDAQATVIGNTSGTNTGDQTTITGNAGTATALQTARTIGGVSFDGTANITVASATGGFTVSGGALALGSQNITSTGSIGATGAGKLTKVWTVDLESTNMPTVGGTSLSSTFSPIAGSASITTVGTIGTGTWQGTAIGDTYISSAATWNAKQSAITFGTGVQTALGVNIGSAGAPILFNGAGGTPSSMVGTNITGTASGLTAGAVTGFTAGAGTLTGPASSGVAVTLGNNETITGVKTMSGLNSVLVSSSGLTVRNPANTFKYTITGAAIAADRQLDLPLITGTATLAVLSLAQTYTATQTFTSPVTTTSITTGSTSFTAWAGATTLLTIGGTGASASLFAPSTLDTSSSTTGAIRTSGGISAAKALNIGTTITAGSTINATTGYKVAGGAASRKVLVGDGTNFIASTETYATPGTTGNVMTSDGTNWTSAAPAGGSPTPTLKFSTIFEDIGRFVLADSTGSQSSSVGNYGLDVSTGATINSYLQRGGSFGPFSLTTNKMIPWDGSPIFSASFSVIAKAGNANFFVGVGRASGGLGFNGSQNFGFKVLVVSGTASLYATQYDGIGATASSALTTLNTNDFVEVIAIKNSTSSIDYYYRINGGSLSSATNLSANVPSGAGGGHPYPFFVGLNNTSANNNEYVVHSMSYER